MNKESSDLSRSGVPMRPFLLGKTAVPRFDNHAVARPRLVDLLRDSQAPLAVVIAPAGWGKTTLLAQWATAAAGDAAVAWLTLDETDNDPSRFWTYVVTALQRAGSSAGTSAFGALQLPGLDPMDVAIPQLLNDLAELEKPHMLVLDDYHLITEPQISEALEFFITYLPQSVRVVIGTRLDPPLPLALWRGRRMLTEIRAGQLRFEAGEAADLVGRTAELDLSPDQLDELVQVTEGWAAGLQLSAMAVRSSPDPGKLVDAISGRHRHVIDFISSEVLGSLAATHRDFLVRTSVLSALCSPLCDAALGIQGSDEILEELASFDPFITSIDDAGWYRCHPVLRDALRREFDRSAEPQPDLVRSKAAQWYLDAGEPEDAIRLLIDAQHHAGAGELLLEYENEFLDRGQIGVFLALAESLDQTVPDMNPNLAVSMAWAAGVAGRHELVAGLLERAEATMTGREKPPDGWSSLAGSAAAGRGIFGYQAGIGLETALENAQRAVALETDPKIAGFSVARLALGLTLTAMGRPDEAVSPLQDAWEHSDVAGMPAFARLPVAAALAMCHLSVGKPDEARSVLSAASPLARRLENALGEAAGPAVGGLTVAKGWLELEHGSAEKARLVLAQGVEQVRLGSPASLTLRALALLAEAELKCGNQRAASAALAGARDIAADDPVIPSVLNVLEKLENRMGRLANREALTAGQMVEELTDRERSILRALHGPLSQREIGRELFLSINTIKGYTKSLYRKLGATSRAEAVEIARAHKLL